MVIIEVDKLNGIAKATTEGNGAIVSGEALVAAGMLLNALSTVTGDDERARSMLIRAIESDEALQVLRSTAEVEEEQ